MTPQLAAVLALLAAAIAMFALNRPRMDAVALIMVAALPFTGVIDVTQALAGFADPNVVLIALLFVVGEGLVRTGVAQRLGDVLVARAGRSEATLVVLLMTMVAAVGSVMSSTGVVAIFIPVVMRIARNAGIDPARLMMPLSVAALVSGMMTLVATAPNLVVHGALVRQGSEGFGFFSFTPFGLAMLVLAIAYMLVARRWLGRRASPGAPPPRPRLAGWIEAYGLAGREHRLRVPAGSPIIGRALAELDLRATSGINILAIERSSRLGRHLIAPQADTHLAAGDVLLLDVFGAGADAAALCRRLGLQPMPLGAGYFADRRQEIGMAELMVPADSSLVGKTVVEARFRSIHQLAVIGMRRGQSPVTGGVLNEKLRVGDTLLAVGAWRSIRALAAGNRDLIVLNLPAEFDEVAPAASRAPFALFALGVLVLLMVTGVVPNVQAALIACLLLGAFGCVDMASAYRAIHWPSLLLIVGMLPFSIALEATGGVALAAGGLLELAGEAGPRTVLAALFAATAVLGLFISNTATAVLMAPVAIAVADAMQASPYPFAMTVALAASAAFMTPVSSPANTLVVGPGGYAFMDFVKIGVPLTVLALVVSMALVPVLLPF